MKLGCSLLARPVIHQHLGFVFGRHFQKGVEAVLVDVQKLLLGLGAVDVRQIIVAIADDDASVPVFQIDFMLFGELALEHLGPRVAHLLCLINRKQGAHHACNASAKRNDNA